MRRNIFSEKCTFVLRAKNDAKTPHFQRLQALSPTRVPVFQDSPPTIVGKKVSLPQKQRQRHLAPRQVTHPPPEHAPRRRFLCPADLAPASFPAFYIHLSSWKNCAIYRANLYCNISCKSVLQDTISSAIILFVAKQATLYAGCKRLRIRHLQRIRAAGIPTYQLSHPSYTTDLLKENQHGHQ